MSYLFGDFFVVFSLFFLFLFYGLHQVTDMINLQQIVCFFYQVVNSSQVTIFNTIRVKCSLNFYLN